VADGAIGAAGVGGDALVAFAADAGRPLERGVLADLALPLRAYLAQIVREDEGRARAVRAIDDGDRLVGQLQLRIERGDLRVVPLGDLAEIDVGEQRAGEFHLAGA